MTKIKDKIAKYFGYIPLERELKYIKLVDKFEADNFSITNNYQELLNEFNNFQANVNKPQPKLKQDVKDIITAIQSQGFKNIGIIQDEFVYIYMFASQTEMYWLQVNYEGEYCYLLKQINNQDIIALCAEICNPDGHIIESNRLAGNVAKDLQKIIRYLTVKQELANTVEYYALTEREQDTANQIKQALKDARKLVKLLREI